MSGISTPQTSLNISNLVEVHSWSVPALHHRLNGGLHICSASVLYLHVHVLVDCLIFKRDTLWIPVHHCFRLVLYIFLLLSLYSHSPVGQKAYEHSAFNAYFIESLDKKLTLNDFLRQMPEGKPCECVCVCACVRACVRACVCMCVCVCITESAESLSRKSSNTPIVHVHRKAF